MQLKAKGSPLAPILLIITIFTTIVCARAAARREIETRSYHSDLRLRVQDVSALDQFWDVVLEQSAKAKAFADKILTEISSGYQDISAKVEEFKTSLDALVADTKEFRAQLNASHLSLGELSQDFNQALEDVGKTILDEFKEPLPEDQSERYQHRENVILFALDKIEVAFVEVCVKAGIQEEKAGSTFESIRPKVRHIISVTGNIIDRHPVLFESIIFTALFMIAPERWLLRPLLRVFGFGTGGPVKGSVAAWLQRTFWGGFVREGSWFAFLQRAGMKGVQWGWWALAGTVWAWIRWFPGWIRIIFKF